MGPTWFGSSTPTKWRLTQGGRARAEADGGGINRERSEGPCRSFDGLDKTEAPGAHRQAQGDELGGASEANPGAASEDAERSSAASDGPGDDLREVSKLALQGGPRGLDGMERQGGQGKQQCITRPEDVHQLGGERARREKTASPKLRLRVADGGPRGEGNDPAARRDVSQIVIVIYEQTSRPQAKSKDKRSQVEENFDEIDAMKGELTAEDQQSWRSWRPSWPS